MNVKGRLPSVTGGASGLGGATAAALAAAGAKVAIFDLQDEPAPQGQGAGGFTSRPTSPTPPHTRLGQGRGRDSGRPAVVVNWPPASAAAARTISSRVPHDLAMFSQVIPVNLIGTFNVIRLASWAMSQAEPMDDGERGSSINTARWAAFDGRSPAAYSPPRARPSQTAIGRDLQPRHAEARPIAPTAVAYDAALEASRRPGRSGRRTPPPRRC